MTTVRFENSTDTMRKWNDVFEALSAEPRRQLIVSLLDAPRDEAVPLPERAINPDAPADPNVLRKELFHRHLPLLDDLGFVEWESDPFVASRGPRFEEVAAVFEALHSHAAELPESLVLGCQRLEREREREVSVSN
ncbi:hypothetical protein [Natronosalvus halobius]|uniref:hypothetical protein n=1 Tax=Natronosalvus halobius TaxID=2953746 RepID=UPI00209CD71A|nr:hypothetical protein [Natronosalvus halobius]USZ70349.1 hypothetical protein NGM15_09460 [Natronosalvus halobius]